MSGPLQKGNEIGGRYRIERFIGEGGMQYVYAARDLLLDRIVALKIPKDAEAKRRFAKSAVLSARVNHPNVAKTLDYLEDSSRQVLIEEFVDGDDLHKALLDRLEGVDPYTVARVFHHMARGIAASHRVRVVHRDLKPSNVMTQGGLSLKEIKITDFGIAKMAEDELIEAAEGGERTMTTSQTAIGALPYMAPEAIETPREVSYGADIWSLGAMGFELITGKKPFGSGLRAVKRIIESDIESYPKGLSSNSQFTPVIVELQQLIESCLKKDVSKRPSADDLVRRCANMCYPVCERLEGIVENMPYRTVGFISASGSQYFFHVKSVFGKCPEVGSKVAFSCFPGEPRSRAHPVVLIK